MTNNTLMKAFKAFNFISGGSVTEADLKRHRAAMERAGRLTAPRGNIRVTSFNAGNIRCEAIRPELAYNPHYVVLYAHGGGYLYGGLSYARILASKIAIATGFTTVTFDYRLAPEHRYPAALSDALAVWDMLTANRYTPGNILLAGESAGGNLALCMIQELVKEKRPIPSHLLLFSPWTDMTADSGSYETNKDIDPILTKEYITAASAAYIGDSDPADPRFSPLFGDLTHLPPTYIMAGRCGILLDDSIRLHDRILAGGGRALLDIEENGWHVYQQMPIPIAQRAMKRLAAYVSESVYGENLWEITGIN